MPTHPFPPRILSYTDSSFEPLHHYARAINLIRRAHTPRQKHWSHTSLRVTAAGLTTTPIAYNNSLFELALDLTTHQLHITTSTGKRAQLPLHGQPLSQFWDELTALLRAFGIQSTAAKPDYTDVTSPYDQTLVQNYFQALAQIDTLLKQFQGELRGETSPVQFWAHHFDLAMLWFSGRLVPDKDPKDEENADEQMNFGFSLGDAAIPEPYCYITAYPTPDGFVNSALPKGATWHTKGWNGALLPYKTLAASPDPNALLLDYWRTTQQRGAELMK